MPNTLIRYMFRDNDNYKEYAEVIFNGAITDDERAALIGALEGQELFEPDNVGLESARGWEDDCGHTANELLTDEITIVERPATDERTISEFVAALEAASHIVESDEPDPVAAFLADFAAWLDDRRRVSAKEADTGHAHVDEWYGSDDTAVDLLRRAARLLGAPEIE
jgi:hypothetical protein